MINIKEAYSFNDLMLVPKYSNVNSRSEVDTSVALHNFRFTQPIIPANMKHCTEEKMAIAVGKSGGLAILHRFMSLKQQLEIWNKLELRSEFIVDRHVGVSIGVKNVDRENVLQFLDVGVKIFCIDIAHGDSKHCVEMIKWMSKFPDILLIAGNVSTGDGARRLWEAGAHVVKVNQGAGSICTTRINTGNGIPQMSALIDIHDIREKMRHLFPYYLPSIISDGGASNSGDLVKALCFSEMVMTGNLFAGCEEVPGKIIHKDGKDYKEYSGSSTHKSNHIEGVKAMVEVKGKFSDILDNLLQGVRSGMSYQGVHNLLDLKRSPEFVKISSAGLRESQSHDVFVMKE